MRGGNPVLSTGHFKDVAHLKGAIIALLSIPFASMYLVEHVSGGAILHAGGGYIANTLVPATVVEAFGVASGVLAKMGAGAATMGGTAVSTPVLISAAALAVVAVGSYCYFHGIPVPVETALSSAGLGTATKQGFMVSVPQLAVALIVLGGAGYVAYRFYQSLKSLRAARLLGSAPVAPTHEEAEATSRGVFGDDAWSNLGASVWACVGDAGRAAAMTAEDAVRGSAALAEKLIAASTDAVVYTKESIGSAASSVAEFAGSVGTSGQAAFRGVSDSVAPLSERMSGFWENLRGLFRRSQT